MVQYINIRAEGILAYDECDGTPPAPIETVILVPGFTKNRKFWYRWLA